MKFRLSIGACILISLALVLFGLGYGTVSGYQQDRAHIMTLLEDENGLLDVLGYRGADGLNLCVVADRHIKGDADVEALRAAGEALRDDKAALSTKKAEDERLKTAVAAVREKLLATPSFNASARDVAYLEMLGNDLKQMENTSVAQTYNDAALKFNASLNAPLSGLIAKLFGVAPCELFE